MLIEDKGVHTYSYPRWYRTFGYLIAMPIAVLFLILPVYLYVTRPLVTLGPLIFNLVVFSLVFYGVIWVSKKRWRQFADVIMDDAGITATVTYEERGRQTIKTGVFTKWGDVGGLEEFGPGDWDARRMGGMTSGLRLFVPGGKVLIFGRLVWRQSGFDQTVALLKTRVRR